MAYEIADGDYTFEAGADLSAAQYKFVKINSVGRVVLAGAGERAIGVLQNNPSAAGQAATVRTRGISKVVTSSVLAQGAEVKSDGNGEAAAVTLGAGSSSNIMGVVLAQRPGTAANSADNDIISVFLQPIGAGPSTPT